MLPLLVACAETGVVEQASTGPTDHSQLTDARIVPGPRGDALVFDETPKNLLVISVDTVRRDRVGLFSGMDTTPNFDAVFSEGVVLADHRSCSNWTAPSSYCAQSGRSHLDDDVWLTAGTCGRRGALPPCDAPTLASILADAGFDTTLVTTNAYFSSAYNGNAYGFEHEVGRYWEGAPVALRAAIDASQDLGADGERWYFHVHWFDPHEDYVAPRAYWTDPRLECPWTVSGVRTQHELEGGSLWAGFDEAEREQARACLFNIYEGEYRYWDEHFAALWSDFEDRGLLDDTLVAFWTDHGQSFGERDNLFNHGVSLYDTENRSTAAFWAQDIERLWWTGPTTHQDIVPTILNALDVPLGDHTGRVLGHARHDRVHVGFNYFSWSQPVISAIQGDKKLLYWWNGTKRFYDLTADPLEESDIYDPSDPDVIALWEELQPIVEHTAEIWPRLHPRDVGP
jgi:arylsulfatase A-like enzyme